MRQTYFYTIGMILLEDVPALFFFASKIKEF